MTTDLRIPPHRIARPGNSRRVSVARGAATGLILGAAWGVVARAWMRLISTDPEFSWSGTLLIITVAAVAGTALGTGAAGRRGRRPRLARAIGAFGVLPLGIGAGMILLPAVVTGAFALPGPIPRRAVRVAVALLPLLGVVVTGLDPRGSLVAAFGSLVLGTVGWFPRAFRPTMAVFALGAVGAVILPLFTDTLPVWRAVLGTAGYLVLLAPLVAVYAFVVRGPHPTQTPPATVGGDIPTKEAR